MVVVRAELSACGYPSNMVEEIVAAVARDT